MMIVSLAYQFVVGGAGLALVDSSKCDIEEIADVFGIASQWYPRQCSVVTLVFSIRRLEERSVGDIDRLLPSSMYYLFASLLTYGLLNVMGGIICRGRSRSSL